MSGLALEISGIFANSSSVIFSLAPIVNIIELFKKKDTSKIPWTLFLIQILNCGFWLTYGVKINAWPIWANNTVGVISNHTFLIIYLFHLDHSLAQKLGYSITLICCSMAALITVNTNIHSASIIGTVAMVLNIVMFSTPMQNIAKVFQFKDNSFIPIELSVCLTVNTFSWIIYGVLRNIDIYLIIPNVIGFSLCIFQIMLWLTFRSASKKVEYAECGDDEEKMNNLSNSTSPECNKSYDCIEKKVLVK